MTPELSNSGVPQDATAQLVALYQTASAKMRAMVLNPTGTSASSQAFNQARAAQLFQQVDRLLQQLNAQAGAWIGQQLPQAYLDGITRAQTQAKATGIFPAGVPVQGSLSLIDQRTVAIFARDMATDLNNAAKSMGQRTKTILRQTAQSGLSHADISRVLAGGVISGQPVQTIRNLREQLRAVHGDKVTITDKNGDPIDFNVGYYASMVARTTTRQATVTSRHDRLQQLGLDLVSIIGLVSKNFCTAYLGQVYSLSGKSTDYPAYSELPGGGPPFHPNCSKSTRPFVAELASDKQLDMADGGDDQDKMLGITPAEAQRNFKDLQLYQQVKQNYAMTAATLFGKAA